MEHTACGSFRPLSGVESEHIKQNRDWVSVARGDVSTEIQRMLKMLKCEPFGIQAMHRKVRCSQSFPVSPSTPQLPVSFKRHNAERHH